MEGCGVRWTEQARAWARHVDKKNRVLKATATKMRTALDEAMRQIEAMQADLNSFQNGNSSDSG